MPKTTKLTPSSYPEVDDIRQDLNSLKENVFALTKHMKSDGSAKTAVLKSVAKDNIEELQNYGQTQLKNVEKKVKTKPMQSIAIAFAGGLLASFLLRR